MKDFLFGVLRVLLCLFLLWMAGKNFYLGILYRGTLMALYHFLIFIFFLVLFAIASVPQVTEWVAGKFVSSLYFPKEGQVETKFYSLPRGLAKRGEFHKAVEEYRRILSHYPEDKTARLELIEILENKLHLLDEALKELEILLQVSKEEKERFFLLNRKVDIYLKKGDKEKAKEIINQGREEWKGKEEEKLLEKRMERL